jgi:phosphohistidine phosphatase
MDKGGGDQSAVEIYLLRHAHAGNPDDWTGDDADRPLSPKGRRQAERLGRFLARNGFKPNAILTSPKVRAHQTAELMAAALVTRIETDHRLGMPLDIDLLSKIVADSGGDRVVIVGHDPDMSDLAAEMVGAQYLPLKKGALARIDTTLPLKPAGALLRWLVPPDLIAEEA